MVCDSHRIRPSSSIVGTSEFGFIRRYSGVLVTPNCMPASTRSYLSPSSSAHHSAFFTLTELVRPQIFSISVRLDPGRLDDRPPFLDFRLVVRGERLGRLLVPRQDLLPG